MGVQLIVTEGPDRGRSFVLEPGQTLQIGRSQATHTKLTDASVSRVHCEVEFDGDTATLINFSSGGTLLNGQSVNEHPLKPGDIIRIGGTELRYQLEPGDAPTAPPPVARGTPAQQLANLVGKTLVHYAVEEVIAKGATGTVFRARDTRNDQVVALKVLQPEFVQKEEDMQRFIRGMKTVLPLRHPNLVTLLGAGRTGDLCWMAMEYVEGESMTAVIQRIGVAGMLDWRYGYRVAVHIARALEYAHEQGIIHRNVAPQNIILRLEDKVAKLGDLMLAKALEGGQQLTRAGELVGDVTYMSPERTRGTGNIDGRSDLYGLGATVYALISGRPPFAGGSLPEMITQIRNAEPEKPKKYQMAIPDLFQGTVMKLLAKRPEERFQSASELLADLDRVGRFSGVSV